MATRKKEEFDPDTFSTIVQQVQHAINQRGDLDEPLAENGFETKETKEAVANLRKSSSLKGSGSAIDEDIIRLLAIPGYTFLNLGQGDVDVVDSAGHTTETKSQEDLDKEATQRAHDEDVARDKGEDPTVANESGAAV